LVDATGKVLLLATTGSDVSIDRVSSDYAVVAAETTAFERLTVVVAQQMTQRLAAFANSGGMVPAGPVAKGPATPATTDKTARTPVPPPAAAPQTPK
jgi:hypothetical protein